MRGVATLGGVLLAACSFQHGVAVPGGDAHTGDAMRDTTGFDATADAMCLAAPTGLVAFWPADGDAKDVIGGHDGTLEDNANATSPGRAGTAFGFDGDRDQVIVASPPQSTMFTIEGWLDIATSTDYRTIYADGSRGFYTHSGQLAWWQSSERYTSTGTVASGTLHHVALSYDGASFTGYIDGVAQGSASYGSATLPTLDPTGIGGHDNEYVTGRIDELSVYNRALMASEIVAIVAAGGTGKCKP